MNFSVATWPFWHAKTVIYKNDLLLFAGILPHLDLFTERAKLAASYCVWLGQWTKIQALQRIRVANVPGQWWVLQCLVSLSCPVHCLPPYDGGGLVHVLVRYCDPVPHGLEQAHHFPHELQPPFTAEKTTTNVHWICHSTSRPDLFSSLAYQDNIFIIRLFD